MALPISACLALGALAIFFMRERFGFGRPAKLHGLLVGVFFGLIAVLVVNFPVTIPLGATFDTRAGPAMLAGFFAGPIAGVTCGVIAAAARYWIGGPSVFGGTLSPLVYAAVGIAAGHVVFTRLRRRPGLADFVLIALAGTLFALPCFFIDRGFAIGLTILSSAWHLLIVGNVAGVAILGMLAEGVRRSLLSHDETGRSLTMLDLARQSAKIAVWHYDFTKDCLEWDEAMFRLYDVDPKHFGGRFADWTACVLPEDLDAASAEFRQARDSGERFSSRFRIRHRDGSIHWIQAYAQCNLDTMRKPFEAIGVNWDVSEHKQLEYNLRAKEKEARERTTELEGMLASMRQGVMLFDADDRLQIWNRQALQLFGLKDNVLRAGMPHEAVVEARIAADGQFASTLPNPRTLRGTLKDERIWRLKSRNKNGAIIATTLSPIPGDGWVETHEDITDLEEATERVRIAAETDALAGLSNRAVFSRALKESIEAARNGTAKPFLLLVDLDRFKAINDRFGHIKGDRLLVEVARILSLAAGASDVVARLGGDEFAIILKQGDIAEAEMLAARLVEQVSRPHVLEGTTVQPGVSIGIVAMDEATTDPETLLVYADAALYKAKSEHMAGYRIFDAEVRQALLTRRRIETGLAAAIAGDVLEIWFQPVTDLADNHVCAYEALARWPQPGGGFIPPGDFIPVAEETGLVDKIGCLALERGLEAMRDWPAGTHLSLNTSPRQFGKGTLVPAIAAALDRHGIAPDRVELEVTENLLIDGSPEVIGELDALTRLGVGLVLDDFGMGYSSLNRLHRYHFHGLKIDRGFILRMEEDATSAAIVSAIAGLARSLGMRCTAEGVETPAQLALVRQAGCDQAQGYLLGRPSPNEQTAPVAEAAS
ncbi:EAL domain-containing protein [Stappia sp.]|uniref:EAL domain-containing protein n=1 Tax=Stappia sp. TaxID=1870903 RepID=UPI003D12E6D0